MLNYIKDYRIWLLASLTLGLAPFVPEPHVWGKLKWVAGGAEGMQLMDWFDLFMHGSPWLLLITSLFIRVSGEEKTKHKRGRLILLSLALLACIACVLISLRP